MSKNPAKQADPAQSQRFIDTARKIEADETETVLNKAMKRITDDAKANQSPKNR